jgi:hypothetical protein
LDAMAICMTRRVARSKAPFRMAFFIRVDQISSLSDRVCKLQLLICSASSPPRKIDEEIE